MNPLLNAIVEDRFDAAIQEAREIDNFLNTTTMDEDSLASEKPLLGLPITVKESIAVQGACFFFSPLSPRSYVTSVNARNCVFEPMRLRDHLLFHRSVRITSTAGRLYVAITLH